MVLRYLKRKYPHLKDVSAYSISFIVLMLNFVLLNVYKTKISNILFILSLLFLAWCFRLLKCSCRATLISFYALIVPYLYILLYSYVSSADFYDFLCLNMLSEDKKDFIWAMMSLVSFGFAILVLLFSDVDIKHGNDKEKQYTLCVAKENGGEVCTYTVTLREKLPLGDSNSKNLPKDAGYTKNTVIQEKA